MAPSTHSSPSSSRTASAYASSITSSTSLPTSLSASSSLSKSQSQYEIYNPSGPLPPCKPNHDFTRKPDSALGRVWWRWRMWFEATFVLSMLEPWEKIMLVTIFFIIGVFFTSAIVTYLPPHMKLMKRRAMYYLVGQEGDERLLWQWLSGLAAPASASQAVAGGAEALGEL